MKKIFRLLFFAALMMTVILVFNSCESGLSNIFNPGNSDEDECEHVWGEWRVVDESSCFNVGQLIRKCEKCNTEESEIIPQLEHQYKGYSCIHCGSDMGDWFEFEYIVQTDSYLLKWAFPYYIPNEVSVPDYYKDKPVTAIGENAFMTCFNITKLTIPNCITSIGDGAFSDCRNLEKIAIPYGITSIGKGVFQGCESLSEVVIPDTVTSIGDYAFTGCAFTEVHIPDSVTYIGSGAFASCRNLIRFVIPDSVTYLGYFALEGCDNLVSVVISNSITTIHEGTFRGCSNLRSVVIPDSVTDIENDTFVLCTELRTVIIGDGVISIGKHTFANCDYLTTIVIGKSVDVIGESAFHKGEEVDQRYYYRGTEEEWNNISISKYNELFLGCPLYYYSEAKPTTGGNFWHWGEGGEIVVWE